MEIVKMDYSVDPWRLVDSKGRQIQFNRLPAGEVGGKLHHLRQEKANAFNED
jgi:hypothetical protein